MVRISDDSEALGAAFFFSVPGSTRIFNLRIHLSSRGWCENKIYRLSRKHLLKSFVGLSARCRRSILVISKGSLFRTLISPSTSSGSGMSAGILKRSHFRIIFSSCSRRGRGISSNSMSPDFRSLICYNSRKEAEYLAFRIAFTSKITLILAAKLEAVYLAFRRALTSKLSLSLAIEVGAEFLVFLCVPLFWTLRSFLLAIQSTFLASWSVCCFASFGGSALCRTASVLSKSSIYYFLALVFSGASSSRSLGSAAPYLDFLWRHVMKLT